MELAVKESKSSPRARRQILRCRIGKKCYGLSTVNKLRLINRTNQFNS